MRRTVMSAMVFVAVVFTACAPSEEFPVLTGEYLGQTPPGTTAELFAPGIVSTGMYTRDVAMMPDGSEIYFGVAFGGFSVIVGTRLEDGRWTEPEVVPFSADPNFMHLEPHITPDGGRMLFLSNRPPDGSALAEDEVGGWTHQNIWAVDRIDDGWGEPYPLGPPVNSDENGEFFPSVTEDGTLYFTRSEAATRGNYIYRSRLVDGQYQEPERLGPQVNSTAAQYNAFIAPDESYIIVPTAGREDSRGGTDYYIVFRDEDDNWSEPINMGDEVNQPRGAEWSPYVSPDGKYFFFMSSRRPSAEALSEPMTFDALKKLHMSAPNGSSAIYWIDAGLIEDLRAEAWGGEE